MRYRKMTGKIGVALLVAQILFLSAGIHDVESHIPAFHSIGPPFQERLSSSSKLEVPVKHRCNACFFNQLLHHCMFPQSPQAAIKETFNPQARVFPKIDLLPALGREADRGPPTAAAFL
jgi:hypothetical protein